MNETAELLFDVGQERMLTIGSVVDRLRAEFPDISVSKLRFLRLKAMVFPCFIEDAIRPRARSGRSCSDHPRVRARARCRGW